jgi:hypothetical protein
MTEILLKVALHTITLTLEIWILLESNSITVNTLVNKFVLNFMSYFFYNDMLLTLWKLTIHQTKQNKFLEGQKKKYKRTNNDLQNTTQKTKNWGWTHVLQKGKHHLLQ